MLIFVVITYSFLALLFAFPPPFLWLFGMTVLALERVMVPFSWVVVVVVVAVKDEIIIRFVSK